MIGSQIRVVNGGFECRREMHATTFASRQLLGRAPRPLHRFPRRRREIVVRHVKNSSVEPYSLSWMIGRSLIRLFTMGGHDARSSGANRQAFRRAEGSAARSLTRSEEHHSEI